MHTIVTVACMKNGKHWKRIDIRNFACPCYKCIQLILRHQNIDSFDDMPPPSPSSLGNKHSNFPGQLFERQKNIDQIIFQHCSSQICLNIVLYIYIIIIWHRRALRLVADAVRFLHNDCMQTL